MWVGTKMTFIIYYHQFTEKYVIFQQFCIFSRLWQHYIGSIPNLKFNPFLYCSYYVLVGKGIIKAIKYHIMRAMLSLLHI